MVWCPWANTFMEKYVSIQPSSFFDDTATVIVILVPYSSNEKSSRAVYLYTFIMYSHTTSHT